MTSTGNVEGVGTLLREWRRRRRVSQLELALRSDSSARHLSFVETGRARPSPSLVHRLAAELDVPPRDRNSLLLAAGYAPAYPETPLEASAMDPLRGHLERLLAAYEPWPALVLDAQHDVVVANRAVGFLLDGAAPELLQPPLNAIRLALHPEGLAPRLRNLGEWRAHLLARLAHQLTLRPSEPVRALYEEVVGYPGEVAPADGDGCSSADGTAARSGQPTAPVGPLAPTADGDPLHRFALPMRIEVGGRVLAFLSTVTTFNSPLDVTVSELAIETFLPADAETATELNRRAASWTDRP